MSIPATSMPVNDNDVRIDPTEWNAWDGFSPMTTLIAQFTSVIDPTLSDLASWHNPGASLATDSPTVVIDVDSGERIAHFAEIEDSPQVAAGHTTLYVRPAARLKENHHYAVGIRGLRTKDGAPVTPSAEFAALRDGRDSKIDAGWYDRDVFGSARQGRRRPRWPAPRVGLPNRFGRDRLGRRGRDARRRDRDGRRRRSRLHGRELRRGSRPTP